MARLSPDSPLVQRTPPTLDPEQVLAALRSELPAGTVTRNVEQHVREAIRLGTKVGIDPAIIIAQTLVETGNYGAIRDQPGGVAWRLRNNPGSIGITGTGGADHDTGLSWPDGTTAARAQIVHLLTYANLDNAPPAAIEALAAYSHLNPRLDLIPGANRHAVKTIRELGGGRYAYDGNYGQKLADRGNDILGAAFTGQETPLAIPTKPDKKTPTQYHLATDYARFGLEQWQANDILGSRFQGRNGGRPEFIVFHIQDGITTGSLDYWSSDVIDASSHVMVQRDGSVLWIIPPEHGAWTNGDVMSPTSEAAEVIAYGGNPNNWTLTIEAEGYPAGPFPQVQLDAIIWVAETWIIRYPHILQHNWSMLRHRHINSQTRWRCPDEGSNDKSLYFAPVVAGVNAWLEGAPVVSTTPPPKPIPTTPPPVVNPPGEGTDDQPDAVPYPEGMTEALAKRLYGRVTVPWSSKEFTFNPLRSECQYWLARGKATMADPKGAYNQPGAQWPELDDVIRRGATKEVHAYRWMNGDVYEKIVRKDR